MDGVLGRMRRSVGRSVHPIGSEPGRAGSRPGHAPLSDLGHRRVVELVEEFHSMLPVFEKAGFLLENFQIEVGLSPKFIPHFMVTHSVSDEEAQAALAELGNRRLLRTVMQALLKASYLRDHLTLGELEFVGLEVYVAAVPTVRLLFGKE